MFVFIHSVPNPPPPFRKVILMDEIDTAFPSRDAMGGSESDRRLVSTLLSLLDGCCANSENETVFVITCTNQPQVKYAATTTAHI